MKDTNLLRNVDGIIHVPFLIKGNIVKPSDLIREQIETAFAGMDKDVRYRKLPEGQLIREPIIDRISMKYTGDYTYQVMPPVNAQDLIETDIDKLVRGPYALSVEDILGYLESIAAILGNNLDLVGRVIEMSRLTSEFPDSFLDNWFASIHRFINRDIARQMIVSEMALWGKPGSEFLNGWVEVSPKSFIRAMPTRQLHITAGNTPEVPVISALRAILTKSAAVIKLPFGATLTGSMLAMAAASMPDHPLTQNLSLVYWQGGDESIENELFTPNAFDRIVVWGSPETVNSVQPRVGYTRSIFFNPRFGISLIGREAFTNRLEEASELAATDSLIYNQKAYTSSLVHYLEGTEEQANQYAGILCQTLRKWDDTVPQFISSSARGQIKSMRRGKYGGAQWYVNEKDGEFTSGIVVIPGEFDILDHPMCRLVIVHHVNQLSEALKYVHPGVSTAGVYPEERRLVLRDSLLARGVSNVLPLGQCERLFAGMPHDGLPVLSQLVDWKNS